MSFTAEQLRDYRARLVLEDLLRERGAVARLRHKGDRLLVSVQRGDRGAVEAALEALVPEADWLVVEGGGQPHCLPCPRCAADEEPFLEVLRKGKVDIAGLAEGALVQCPRCRADLVVPGPEGQLELAPG